jgi:hypothetical protein
MRADTYATCFREVDKLDGADELIGGTAEWLSAVKTKPWRTGDVPIGLLVGLRTRHATLYEAITQTGTPAGCAKL